MKRSWHSAQWQRRQNRQRKSRHKESQYIVLNRNNNYYKGLSSHHNCCRFCCVKWSYGNLFEMDPTIWYNKDISYKFIYISIGWCNVTNNASLDIKLHNALNIQYYLADNINSDYIVSDNTWLNDYANVFHAIKTQWNEINTVIFIFSICLMWHISIWNIHNISIRTQYGITVSNISRKDAAFNLRPLVLKQVALYKNKMNCVAIVVLPWPEQRNLFAGSVEMFSYRQTSQ